MCRHANGLLNVFRRDNVRTHEIKGASYCLSRYRASSGH
ncbi:hypothetical protein TYRP_017131 [Tyrophagus putrescentiae]|nr:hypothetical protein TYRP_017131 [Tyrophagus putrescentiae]